MKCLLCVIFHNLPRPRIKRKHAKRVSVKLPHDEEVWFRYDVWSSDSWKYEKDESIGKNSHQFVIEYSDFPTVILHFDGRLAKVDGQRRNSNQRIAWKPFSSSAILDVAPAHAISVNVTDMLKSPDRLTVTSSRDDHRFENICLVTPRAALSNSSKSMHSLRGRRLEGKGKGVLCARETLSMQRVPYVQIPNYPFAHRPDWRLAGTE